jgi:protease I
MASVLIVVPQDRFSDEELFETLEELERAGHLTSIASSQRGTCFGVLGGSVDAQEALSWVDMNAYDAVVFVGGPGAVSLFWDEDAARVAREMDRASKAIGAICLAPMVLATCGILRGRRATVVRSESDALEAEGATYAGTGVLVDGNVVTADDPAHTGELARSIAAMLDAQARRVSDEDELESKRPRSETD